MKKIILTALAMALSLSLMATIIYVPDNYQTIELAVNAATHGDEVIVRDGVYYEELTIGLQSFTLRSENGPDNCTIIPYSSSIVLTQATYNTIIQGFTIEDAPYGAVTNYGYGEINDCIFEDNTGANWASAISSFQFMKLSNNIFKNNSGYYTVLLTADYPLGQNPNVVEIVKNNLFYNNTNTTYSKDLVLSNPSQNYHGIVLNNTFVGSSGGIRIEGYIGYGNSDVLIKNCIFDQAGLSAAQGVTKSSVSISYNGFTHSGYPFSGYSWGLGNLTNLDPKFNLTDDYTYYLLEGSPCIDAGDPAQQYNDTDGTCADMGCYPSTTDIKPLAGNTWNWVSFPRLADNFGTNAPPLFEQMIPFPNAMELWQVGDFLLKYDPFTFWDPDTYPLFSEQGYKLNPQQAGDYIQPLEGDRLAANHTITPQTGVTNPVGYWLPQTQLWTDAISSADLANMIYINAQDWYVYKKNGQWYGMVGPNGATFEYGKGYEIGVSQTINSFQWQQSGQFRDAYVREATEFFTYQDKPNYEMLEVEEIENGEDIIEIGVFVDGECVGASKVTEYPVHILAYTEDANRNHTMDFVIITGRSGKQEVKETMLYNFDKEVYETASLFPQRARFSRVKLNVTGEAIEEAAPAIKLALSNYPNPFNPSTTIAFTLAEETEITLEIYNIKGQKVATLINGNLRTGKQEIVWNGVDENGVFVSSGIYFSRLTVGEKKLLQKMMLLK
jgi:hypothetical protein